MVLTCILGFNIHICIGYHTRGEVISVLSLERRYHVLSRVSAASLECDNLFITYLCLYLELKPDYIFKLFILQVHFKMNSKLLFKIR